MPTPHTVIALPVYQPEEDLLRVVQSFPPKQAIVVINDGSTRHTERFEALSAHSNVTLLQHPNNQGKGAALKTAMVHFLKHFSEDYHSLITADADGQHDPNDIAALQACAEAEPTALHLGVRQFPGTIPWRSRFGNRLTRFIFSLVIHRNLSDTQSGLRAIPRAFIPELLRLKSSAYDFELDMLITASQQHWIIKEMPIKTIYQAGNPSSHFKALTDSVKIYFVFLRFCALALSTGLLDLALFALSFYFSHNIFSSMVFARCIAGTYNFYCGKRLVFQSASNTPLSAFRYISLAIALMVTAYFFLSMLVIHLHWNVYFSKLFSECCLFFLNFAIQRCYVFAKPPNKIE